MKEIHITKLDAARRQLETAILLWFGEGDPVSIHTLLSAGLTILHDIGEGIGKPSPMLSGENIKPEFHKEWFKIVREAQNFFKHADKDPHDTLDFRPDTNKYGLFEACDLYLALCGSRTSLMTLFGNYFAVTHPQYFKSISPGDVIRFGKLPRRELFEQIRGELQMDIN